MIIAGDKVSVTVAGDPFYGDIGEVVDKHVSDSDWVMLAVVFPDTEDIGSPELWYSFNEVRKVES